MPFFFFCQRHSPVRELVFGPPAELLVRRLGQRQSDIGHHSSSFFIQTTPLIL
jgi:hypothetical protein